MLRRPDPKATNDDTQQIVGVEPGGFDFGMARIARELVNQFPNKGCLTAARGTGNDNESLAAL